MDLSALIEPALGAAVGFALAQLVDIARNVREWWQRPAFKIEFAKNAQLLIHSVEAGHGSLLDETIYGFSVKNTGRSIATGVQFQLIKIETRKNENDEFRLGSDHTYSLALFEGSDARTQPEPITLLPGAQVDVHLATEREGTWAIMPAIRRIPDYFEESHSTTEDYRFTVAVFDDKSRSASATITIFS